MKVTKFEHACLLIDNGKDRLVIDPGDFTNLPDEMRDVSSVIVTEEHADHFNIDNIRQILAQNPEAKIISTTEVARKLQEAGYACDAVDRETSISIGDFELHLMPTDHATIYQASLGRVLTVRVDDFLYYPSDSYVPIDRAVKVLALPTSGPWHKISESIDLVNTIQSRFVLATHNGLYNETGHAITNRSISSNIMDKSREYVMLSVGDTKDF